MKTRTEENTDNSENIENSTFAHTDEQQIAMASLLVRLGVGEDDVAAMDVGEVERRLKKRLGSKGVPADATPDELSIADSLGFSPAPNASKTAVSDNGPETASTAPRKRKSIKDRTDSPVVAEKANSGPAKASKKDSAQPQTAKTPKKGVKGADSQPPDKKAKPAKGDKGVPQKKTTKGNVLAEKKMGKTAKTSKTPKSRKGFKKTNTYYVPVAKILDREKPISRDDTLAKMQALGMSKLTSISYLCLATRSLKKDGVTKGGKAIVNPFGIQVEMARRNGTIMVRKVDGGAPASAVAVVPGK